MIDLMVDYIFIAVWSFLIVRNLHWYLSGEYKNKKGWVYLYAAILCFISMLKTLFT